jgi:hypothetical protein
MPLKELLEVGSEADFSTEGWAAPGFFLDSAMPPK